MFLHIVTECMQSMRVKNIDNSFNNNYEFVEKSFFFAY